MIPPRRLRFSFPDYLGASAKDSWSSAVSGNSQSILEIRCVQAGHKPCQKDFAENELSLGRSYFQLAARDQGVDEKAALDRGMQEKAREFRAQGGEVYKPQ